MHGELVSISSYAYPINDEAKNNTLHLRDLTARTKSPADSLAFSVVRFAAVPIWIGSLIEDRPQNGAHLARAAGSVQRKGGRIGGRVLDVCRRSITLRLTSGWVYSRTARSGSTERISRVSRRAPLNLHFICFISGCLLFFSTRNVQESRRIARRAPLERIPLERTVVARITRSDGCAAVASIRVPLILTKLMHAGTAT